MAATFGDVMDDVTCKCSMLTIIALLELEPERTLTVGGF
jgi:hypothetical protein